jgi:hypothetical protein
MSTIEGLSFTISPEKATEKFYSWAYEEQGLRYILNANSVRLSAALCPVWSFDINIRYVATDTDGKQKLGWKPDLFQDAYGNQSVAFLPGLSSYAGYSYRRSLLNPLHSISLVFLGNQTMPFGKWMLRDMKLANGQTLEIVPDAWNCTKSRALAVVKEELDALAMDSPYPNVRVQTEVVASKRVYMPTYVFEYNILGAQYLAFVSGCDAGVGVSGDSHKLFGSHDGLAPSVGFLNQAFGNAQTAARVLGPRGILAVTQLLLGLAGRLLVRLPLFASVAAIFVGFRKVVQPFFRKRSATAAWERQREHEAAMDDDSFTTTGFDFADSGAARTYFEQNRGRILSRLSSSGQHVRGEYDWYKAWEAWAREQYQKQQQQQQYGRQREQQQSFRQKSRPTQEYKWDFDPNDPYAVLGIKKGASMTELSAAYRKQMLAHHPDVQHGRSEAEKQRAVERTKLINEAYRQLRQSRFK